MQKQYNTHHFNILPVNSPQLLGEWLYIHEKCLPQQ